VLLLNLLVQHICHNVYKVTNYSHLIRHTEIRCSAKFCFLHFHWLAQEQQKQKLPPHHEVFIK